MKPLKHFLDFFLYGNIFISVCAAAITIETYLLVHLGINWVYVTFVFFSTLVIYDFPSLFFAQEAFSINQSERHRWIIENRRVLIVLTAIAVIAISVLLFFFLMKFILWFVPTTLLAFAYFFPQTRLRKITGLKATIVAWVWTMVTAFYPLLLIWFTNAESSTILSEENIFLITERFLFMFPLCVIFNVRDVEADGNAGIKTIPVVYGMGVAIFLCLVSLFLFCSLVFFNRGFSSEAIALTASAIVSGILILKSSIYRDDYFYSLWVDGMIILQAGFLWLQNLFYL